MTTGLREQDVATDGLRLHYEEWGSPESPPILMLHGFGVSGRMFEEFAAAAQDAYRLVALDQRGHGDSEWSPDADYTREAFVRDIEVFGDAVGLDRFVLMGHSMGGLNAVSYTVQHPERVRALILIDVSPEAAKDGADNIMRFAHGPDELEFEEFVEMAHRFNPRRNLDNIRGRMRYCLRPTGNGKYTWKFDSRFLQQDSGLRFGSQPSNDEAWQLFRRASVPTLLVRGAESDVLPQDIAERAVREMQQARLVTIPNAGHSVPEDNPNDFTNAVRRFLAKLWNGDLEPAGSPEPRPLHELVEEQEAAHHRGVGFGTLIVVGIGAALAVAGVGYALTRRSDEGARRPAPKVFPSSPPSMRRDDFAAVGRRVAATIAELSSVGRDRLTRASQLLRETNLNRARDVARDTTRRPVDEGLSVPAAIRSTRPRVNRPRLGGTGRSAWQSGRTAAMSMSGAVSRLAVGKPRPRRRRLLWRG